MNLSAIFPVDVESISRSNDVMKLLTPTSHVVLCLCFTFVVLLGLSGNLFVLYASLVRKALMLDRPSLVLVHVLAVVDILSSVLIFLPILVTLVAKKWVLGEAICGFQGFFFIAPLQCEMLVILTASGKTGLWFLFLH